MIFYRNCGECVAAPTELGPKALDERGRNRTHLMTNSRFYGYLDALDWNRICRRCHMADI
jgi:hypothetical protein